MDFKSEFFNLVGKANSIVITSHTSPDDDSIGSLLSLFQIIKQKYPEKKIRMVQTGEKIDRYSHFKNYELIEFVPDLTNSLGDMDLLIVLDGGGYGRFSKNPDELKSLAKQTICIDHHSSPPDTFTLSTIDPEAVSTCELIYKIFHSDTNITKPIAETILLGILGAPGYFGYVKPSQIEIFDICKQLIQIADVELQKFRSMYDTISPNVYKILQKIIANSIFMETPGWPKFLYSYFEKNGESDNDISDANLAFVSIYLRYISGYTWGFVISSHSDSTCKMSLRSLPESVKVRDIVEKMGIGGGHDRAAGGTFKLSNPKECIDKILNWMKENQPILS